MAEGGTREEGMGEDSQEGTDKFLNGGGKRNATYTPRKERRKRSRDEEEPEIDNWEPPPPIKSRFKMWWWWVGLLAVGFVYLLVGWPYIIFMWQIWIPLCHKSIVLGIFAFLLCHVTLGLLMTSYMRTVFTDPGFVPLNYLEEHNREEVNICNKCDNGKPERAHHCSLCRRCILKMDHHCPWVNNCVGFRNYKFFVLFLTYIPVAETLLLAFSIPHVIFNIPFDELMYWWNLQVVIISLMAVIFGLGMAGFAAMHYNILLKNQTTLENFVQYTVKKVRTSSGRKRYVREMVPNIYDCKSWRANFEQIFGTNPWLWFLPVHTEQGDGMSFPHNADALQDESERGRRRERRRDRGRSRGGVESSDTEDDEDRSELLG